MTPEFVDTLVRKLRYHGLPIGVDDLNALRQALAAGFGWSGTAALRELCVMLWASTLAEAAVVRAAFNQADPPSWGDSTSPDSPPATGPAPTPGAAPARPVSAPVAPSVRPIAGLPAIDLEPLAADPSLIYTPQYPLSAREIAQAWRRLRRAVRQGPPVELDVEATLRRRGRSGVATPPVLVPRYRNTARLLLLIDRQGSMTPFHGYVEHLRGAIEAAGRVDALDVAYFHDTPDRRPDRAALRGHDPVDPAIDSVLPFIAPMSGAAVYVDPGLLSPRPLDSVLEHLRPGTAVAVISDAGAARRRMDTVRLVESVAMVKALSAAGGTVCWLNPAPVQRWVRSTAEQIARHVPMFPLTRPGMYGAVEVLRGRPRAVERPL